MPRLSTTNGIYTLYTEDSQNGGLYPRSRLFGVHVVATAQVKEGEFMLKNRRA